MCTKFNFSYVFAIIQFDYAIVNFVNGHTKFGWVMLTISIVNFVATFIANYSKSK